MTAPWHWGRAPWEYDEELAADIGRERIDIHLAEQGPDLVDELGLILRVELSGDSREDDLELPRHDDTGARQALTERVRSAMHLALDEVLRERDDILPLQLGGRIYWVTGGEPWGDTPTDAYNPIAALDTIALLDAPLPHPRHR